MANLTCSACPVKVIEKESMRCSTCKACFHPQCVNITVKDVKKLNVDLKNPWVCPLCVLKQPKSGDNSNTPIGKRNPGSKSDAAQYDNVTLRAKPAKSLNASQSSHNIEQHSHECITKEDVREVIQVELSRVLSTEVAKIIHHSMQAIHSEVAVLKEEVSSMKESMQYMNYHFEEMKKETEDKFKTSVQLQKEVDILKTENSDLLIRINEIEQQARASNIEIQCVPEYKSENLVSTTLQLAKVVSCDVKAEDIHHCTRTAKLDENSSRPRNIVVKLKSPIVRDSLLAAVINFNKTKKEDKLSTSHLGIGGDKKPVYVTEHLTPYNKKIHKEARLAAKEKQYKYVWIRSGRILVRKDDKAQAIVLKNLDSIKRLI